MGQPREETFLVIIPEAFSFSVCYLWLCLLYTVSSWLLQRTADSLCSLGGPLQVSLGPTFHLIAWEEFGSGADL